MAIDEILKAVTSSAGVAKDSVDDGSFVVGGKTFHVDEPALLQAGIVQAIAAEVEGTPYADTVLKEFKGIVEGKGQRDKLETHVVFIEDLGVLHGLRETATHILSATENLKLPNWNLAQDLQRTRQALSTMTAKATLRFAGLRSLTIRTAAESGDADGLKQAIASLPQAERTSILQEYDEQVAALKAVLDQYKHAHKDVIGTDLVSGPPQQSGPTPPAPKK